MYTIYQIYTVPLLYQSLLLSINAPPCPAFLIPEMFLRLTVSLHLPSYIVMYCKYSHCSANNHHVQYLDIIVLYLTLIVLFSPCLEQIL